MPNGFEEANAANRRAAEELRQVATDKLAAGTKDPGAVDDDYRRKSRGLIRPAPNAFDQVSRSRRP